MAPYSNNDQLFFCPSDPAARRAGVISSCAITGYFAFATALSRVPKPSTTSLMGERGEGLEEPSNPNSHHYGFYPWRPAEFEGQRPMT